MQLRKFCIHKLLTVRNQNMPWVITYFSLKCLILKSRNLSQFGSVSSVYHCVKWFSVMSRSLYQYRIQIVEIPVWIYLFWKWFLLLYNSGGNCVKKNIPIILIGCDLHLNMSENILIKELLSLFYYIFLKLTWNLLSWYWSSVLMHVYISFSNFTRHRL